jgi:hypothetical protein
MHQLISQIDFITVCVLHEKRRSIAFTRTLEAHLQVNILLLNVRLCKCLYICMPSSCCSCVSIECRHQNTHHIHGENMAISLATQLLV